MEVLIRWRCCLCSASVKQHCRYCDNQGFMERWIPYFLLRDVRAAIEEAVIIAGCRKII
jgi:hypothetical protein